MIPLVAPRDTASSRPLAAGADPRVRVLICDDSLTVRGAMCRIIESDPALLLVGRAGNGAEALRQAAALKPDVLVLDVEMPVMDGLSALPSLLRADPGLKVLMASALTTRGADIALSALRAGAADYVPKPSSAGEIGAADGFRAELLAKVKALGRRRRTPLVPLQRPTARATPAYPPRVLAIGASTGGPQALFTLFSSLPRQFPLPVVVTQHMPKTFTAMLAEHITRLGFMPCAEAADGAVLRPGEALLAPGERHLLIEPRADRLVARLSDAAPENFCRPAVDPMLRSLAAATAGQALAVILTGMGHDGLAGSRALVAAGGQVLAQDEASSVVWGMPGAVAQAGLAAEVLPIASLAARIIALTVGGRA